MVARGTRCASACLGEPCVRRGVLPAAGRLRAQRGAARAAGERTDAAARRGTYQPAGCAAGRSASVFAPGPNLTSAGAICSRRASRDEVLVHGSGQFAPCAAGCDTKGGS